MTSRVPIASVLPIFYAARMGLPIYGSINIDDEQVNWFTSHNCYLRIQFGNFLVSCTTILGRQYYDHSRIISHLEMSVFVPEECFNKWKLDVKVFNAEYEIMMDKLTQFFVSVNEFNHDNQKTIEDRRTDFDTIAHINYTQFRDQVNAIDIQTGIIQPYCENSENRSLL